jgi:hypothetical protein
MSTPRSVHAILTTFPDGRDHAANSRCACDPIVCRDLEEVGRLVYIHRWADVRSTGDTRSTDDEGERRPVGMGGGGNPWRNRSKLRAPALDK